jgi:hypothetical protein
MAFVADHEPPNMVGGSVRTIGRFPGISPDEPPTKTAATRRTSQRAERAIGLSERIE